MRSGDCLKMLRTSSTISSLGEMARRQVEADLQVRPLAERRARLLQHPPHQRARQFDDQAARLGERNEHRRRHDACRRACASGSAPRRRAACPSGYRRSAGSTARTRRRLSARSMSTIGLRRSRRGNSTDSARMKMARRPLATVPMLRRSLCAEAEDRARGAAILAFKREAARRHVDRDQIVRLRRALDVAGSPRSARPWRSASGRGSSSARRRSTPAARTVRRASARQAR